MRKTSTLFGIAIAVAGTALAAQPAEARSRSHWTSVQGSHGHGYVRSRSILREPGHVAASRRLQTNRGYGHDSSRSASWGDGHYSGGATHRLNDGRVYSRSTSLHDNGDGTVSYDRTRSGPGYDRSRSGTFTRPGW